MAGSQFTSPTQSFPQAGADSIVLNGGINSTAGPLELQNNESSDLLNIDFDKFGSILKRSGYTTLNATAVSGSPVSNGLYWFEYNASGTYTSKAILAAGAKMLKMDDLDGTWDDITGPVTITDGYNFDFETWNNQMFATNGKDKPITWAGASTASNLPVFNADSYSFAVTGITTAPAVGDTYTNNGVTYTITGVYVSGAAAAQGGTLVVTGSGAPEVAGDLTVDAGAGDASIAFSAYYVNANIESAKYVKQYNNYLFWANVVVGSTYYKTRVYWSEIRNPNIVQGSSWIEIGLNDGQEITRIKVLQDRLVVYKTRSIYNIFFTGDADIPFVMPGGGKSNSPIGCIAPFSIQEVENGHVFLAADGIYYYDGMNSTKLSNKINSTLAELNQSKLSDGVSAVYKSKNRYFIALTSSGQVTHDRVIVWDYFNNAFSIYSGMAPAAMCSIFLEGFEEYTYFADYLGFVYKMDTGKNDYPLNAKTAINAYYYTNWRHYMDLCDQKGVPNIYIYYQVNNAVMSFSYSYEFETTDQYSYTFATYVGTSVYGTAVYGVGIYSGAGGAIKRVDLTGRGRVVRFKFSNAVADETFRIEGFGSLAYHETSV